MEGRMMLRGLIGTGLTFLMLAGDTQAQSRPDIRSAANISEVSAQRGLDKGLLVQYRYRTDAQLGYTRGGGLRVKKEATPRIKKETITRTQQVAGGTRQVTVVTTRQVTFVTRRVTVLSRTARPNFNLACKAKYPSFVGWMERQWTRCRAAPSPAYGEEQLKAWQCWCRAA
jgi:hypothetical protein